MKCYGRRYEDLYDLMVGDGENGVDNVGVDGYGVKDVGGGR